MQPPLPHRPLDAFSNLAFSFKLIFFKKEKKKAVVPFFLK